VGQVGVTVDAEKVVVMTVKIENSENINNNNNF